MERVLWVGRRPPPKQLVELLHSDHGVQLSHHRDAEAAINASAGQPVAVAIVNGHQAQAPKMVEKLVAARPDVQVLLASDAGIERHVVLALSSGASGVLEFKSQSKTEIVQEIQEWIGRHRQVRRERELLLRLHALNEEFLKTIIAAERRKIELDEQLEARRAPAAAPDEGPAQVLLIDRDPAVQRLLRELLASHELTTVNDGDSALKALATKGFHLVIADQSLPGAAGFEVMRQLKRSAPDTDVVMITAFSTKEAALQALELGAAAFLEKPFTDTQHVRERIDKVIDHRRRQQKGQRYLTLIKDRNRDFLERYRVLRADLEAWMAVHSHIRKS